MADPKAPCYGFKESEWVFDQNVLTNWKSEVEGHIPDYWTVINLGADIVERVHGKSARVLSFWVAVGNQFIPFLKRQWDPKNLFGMNYSEPMDRFFREKFSECPSRQVDIATRPYDPTIDGPFDVVLIHWSLHFEPVAKRTEVLENVFKALNPGGSLILTDKTLQSDVVESLYHDYKRSMGVSDAEIAAKKKAIVGVLVSLPSQWFENTFKDIGFEDICIVHANVGFVTWHMRKPPVTA